MYSKNKLNLVKINGNSKISIRQCRKELNLFHLLCYHSTSGATGNQNVTAGNTSNVTTPSVGTTQPAMPMRQYAHLPNFMQPVIPLHGTIDVAYGQQPPPMGGYMPYQQPVQMQPYQMMPAVYGPQQPYVHVASPQYYGPAWVGQSNTVLMPAVTTRTSAMDVGASARIQHGRELTEEEKQFLVHTRPQPYANVVGSWPVRMNTQAQAVATKSQRYYSVFYW